VRITSRTLRSASPRAVRRAGPLAAGIAVLLLVPLGCHRSGRAEAAEGAPAPPAAHVGTVTASSGEIARRLRLPGSVRALQAATLYAKVPGYLRSIAVDVGDRVETGAVLAEIESPEMLADLAKLRVEARLAKLDYDRLRKAQADAPDLVMQQTVDEARAAAESARASLQRVETLLDYARITAPFSGIVTERFVDPGAFIPAATASSAARNAAVLTLMDFRRVRVDVAVPEPDVVSLHEQQIAHVTAPGLAGRRFDGVVTRFAYALADDTRTMAAEVWLDNPDLALRPGMMVDVEIALETKQDATLLPAEALVSEKGRQFVMAVRDGHAQRLPVRIGIDDGVLVEIVEGLAPGERVVVAGREGLRDGDAVDVAAAP